MYTVGPDAGAVVQDINPDTYDVTLKFGIPQGKKGDKGFSPKATVTQTYDNDGTTITGATITIVDENRTTTAIIPKGDKGDAGAVDNLTVSSNPLEKGFFVEDISYSYEEGEGGTKGDGTIQVQYKALSDAKDELGISNINTNISAINTNISAIDNKINELILVSNTQPQNSNTQIWFDTSNPIGG